MVQGKSPGRPLPIVPLEIITADSPNPLWTCDWDAAVNGSPSSRIRTRGTCTSRFRASSAELFQRPDAFEPGDIISTGNGLGRPPPPPPPHPPQTARPPPSHSPQNPHAPRACCPVPTAAPRPPEFLKAGRNILGNRNLPASVLLGQNGLERRAPPCRRVALGGCLHHPVEGFVDESVRWHQVLTSSALMVPFASPGRRDWITSFQYSFAKRASTRQASC